jgi:hypothetical protein
MIQRETNKHREALLYYCAMEKRDYEALALHFGYGVRTVKRWADDFEWERQVDQFDKEVIEELRWNVIEDWVKVKAYLLGVLMDQVREGVESGIAPKNTKDVIAAIREIRSMMGDVAEANAPLEGIVYTRTLTNDEGSTGNTDI